MKLCPVLHNTNALLSNKMCFCSNSISFNLLTNTTRIITKGRKIAPHALLWAAINEEGNMTKRAKLLLFPFMSNWMQQPCAEDWMDLKVVTRQLTAKHFAKHSIKSHLTVLWSQSNECAVNDCWMQKRRTFTQSQSKCDPFSSTAHTNKNSCFAGNHDEAEVVPETSSGRGKLHLFRTAVCTARALAPCLVPRKKIAAWREGGTLNVKIITVCCSSTQLYTLLRC